MVIIDDEIISGFIGEAISRCADFSWTKIKEVVNDKKNKHQNIESQIYNVVVNVLSQITYNKFENNQDKIYQAVEKLLMSYKNDRCGNIEGLRSGLQILGESVNSDKYMEFKALLYQEISKGDYEELYRQIRLLQQDEESDKTSRIEKKVDKLQQSADETNRRLDAFKESNRVVDNVHSDKPVESRTQEYADKWKANMFLNDFDEWDRSDSVNVKLCDVYIDEHLPHFINGHYEKEFDNLDVLLSRYIMRTKENKMLLILGQPGIGKSTLITWITVNFTDRINDILVYRFASDLENIDWKNGGISNRVLEELGLNHSDLNGKILILDGFDEVSVEEDRRRVLDNLYGELIYKKNIDDFSLIITCRENYIQGFERVKCKYIILQPWNETQIRSFCNIFQEKAKGEISGNTIDKLIENKEILGIPLILYMILALNISVEKEGSIVDIYDKIFSLDGGIYDRCIDNKKFADAHRIGKIKEYVHQISRDIAIWIFENEAEKASIPQKEYQMICRKIMQEDKNFKEIEQDFLISNFFKLVKHCEGIETEELYFVHRTIYEYFVVETIYSAVESSMMKLSDESQEKLAGNIAVYLKQGEINYTIGEYLKYKFLKLYNKLNTEKQELFYQWWEKIAEKMMKMGMFYYTENVSNYANIFAKETQCFNNLIEILRLIYSTNKKQYILENVDPVLFMRYIKHSLVECRILYIDSMGIDNTEQVCGGYVLDLSKLNLMKAYFEMCNLSAIDLSKVNLKYSILNKANLRGANLRGANLRGANLNEANLNEANLNEANLLGANLIGADLIGANLIGADLREANLLGANLIGADLIGANLIGANLIGADLKMAKLRNVLFDEKQVGYLEQKYSLVGTEIYIKESQKIISYEKFRMRKQ